MFFCVWNVTTHLFFSLFQLRLNEGALVISRSGLAKMGVVLELETVYGFGRDSLIGLHTLALSYNQLQASKTSFFTAIQISRISPLVSIPKAVSPPFKNHVNKKPR